MRHIDEGRRGARVSSLAYDYPAGWSVHPHAHRSDQLIYATSGVMEVTVARTRLLVPPQAAVWIAAHTVHSIRMPTAVSMRTLYLQPDLAAVPNCAVLYVTPLLKELVAEVVRIGSLQTVDRRHVALGDVLVDQLERSRSIPTTLAMPLDPRARRLADLVLADLEGRRPSAALCDDVGLSVRTMQRIFRRELGVDFDTWRRQARLLKAVEMLAAGTSIKQVAFAVGYRQPSTFVAIFSAHLGRTPKVWISAYLPRA